MSNTMTHQVATRLRRRTVFAALALFTVVAIGACDGRGSGLIGTGGTPIPDASLKSMTVSAGTLTPAFDSVTTSYALAVTATTVSITVSPVAKAAGSTITVNGGIVASGGTSPSIPLVVGSTSVLVTVTASDNITVKTYTIAVLRPAT
ncbi:MAG: cadherin-like beta sandwich domain-containing protein [Gemmatimonadaceae bacterium]